MRSNTYDDLSKPENLDAMPLEELYCYEKLVALRIDALQEDGLPEIDDRNYKAWRAKYDSLQADLKEVQEVISWKEKDL